MSAPQFSRSPRHGSPLASVYSGRSLSGSVVLVILTELDVLLGQLGEHPRGLESLERRGGGVGRVLAELVHTVISS